MVDPRSYIDKLVPSLLPVPAAQPGVCALCRSSTDTWSRCRQCSAAGRAFGELPRVVPIALTTADNPLHEALRGYKNSPDAAVRHRHRLTAAGLLATFVNRHGRCLGDFDSVTAIPSLTRTAVRNLLEPITELTDRYADALAPSRSWTGRELAADRYVVTRPVAGERILVIDDTFTSGATLYSACEALRGAGAVVVGPVVIGRFVRTGWKPSDALLARLSDHQWTYGSCIRCTGGVELGEKSLF